MSKAEENLKECMRLLDIDDYYNGGQTVQKRFPLGSEGRARIVAEATFWQGQVAAEKGES